MKIIKLHEHLSSILSPSVFQLICKWPCVNLPNFSLLCHKWMHTFAVHVIPEFKASIICSEYFTLQPGCVTSNKIRRLKVNILTWRNKQQEFYLLQKNKNNNRNQIKTTKTIERPAIHRHCFFFKSWCHFISIACVAWFFSWNEKVMKSAIQINTFFIYGSHV